MEPKKREMNTEGFVTYEQALALKKLGFKEKCLYSYNVEKKLCPHFTLVNDGEQTNTNDLYYSDNSNITFEDVADAPTLAQAQKWLRKEKKYSVEPHYNNTYWDVEIINMDNEDCYEMDSCFVCDEEALSAGITECLKFLEK